ncbi:MAG TPA: alpha/beta fold hydrolase [Acidobacteriaceae bacterium]|nr:alpha/beta fold hydrolase [Acidobacteriaceae bacterium]
MTVRKLSLIAVTSLLACAPLFAQQPAITADPTPNPSAPTQNLETVLDSHGSHIDGVFLLASGTEPHPTAILLHGFPGYEQNIDLAQALRRDGWNVLALHYRGSWGSQGAFSFTHCMEDVGTMLAYVTAPANVTKFHIDTHHLVVIGHSMGGFLTVAALAQHPALKAGVVITEGSPVHDTNDYFANIDPADFAPLAGTSPAALQHEAQTHATDWTFPAFAAKISPRPILDISANDGLRASNEALVAALKQAGSPVTSIHFDTDHGFTDHRIALESAILKWLDDTAR